MKRFLNIILLVIILSSCETNYSSLRELNSIVVENEQLKEFTSLNVSGKSINYTPICISQNECQSNEKESIETVLGTLSLDLDTFRDISDRMKELGLLGYYHKNGYSLWVSSGAFGEIRGYAIRDHNSNFQVDNFRLDDHLFIEIGNKIEEDIFHFRGN